MRSLKFNWLVLSFGVLLSLLCFIIRTQCFADIITTDLLKYLISAFSLIFFFGLLFKFYNFKKNDTDVNGFKLIPLLAYVVTSLLLYFQSSMIYVYMTLSIWIVFVILFYDGKHMIRLKQDVLDKCNSDNQSNRFSLKDNGEPEFNIGLLFFLTLWITGILFLEIGYCDFIGFNFSDIIYKQITFLKWVLDVRLVVTVILILSIIIRPIFLVNIKLKSIEISIEESQLPENVTFITIFSNSLSTLFIKANKYLTSLLSYGKNFFVQYWMELTNVLKSISQLSISVSLITLSLVSILFLSKIAELESGYILQMLTASSYLQEAGYFLIVFCISLVFYVIYVVNKIILRFPFHTLQEFYTSIWYVITGTGESIINFLGLFMFVSLLTTITEFGYNLFLGTLSFRLSFFVCFSFLFLFVFYLTKKVRKEIP